MQLKKRKFIFKSLVYYFIFLIIFFNSVIEIYSATTQQQQQQQKNANSLLLEPPIAETLKNQMLESTRKQYDLIKKQYFYKARFETAINELLKILPNIPSDLKSDAYLLLAKSYYLNNNQAYSYKYFKYIYENMPKSEIITSGKYQSTIIKIIKAEAENQTQFTLTYPLKLYQLLRAVGINQTDLNSVEQAISKRLNEKVKISINLQNERIVDYENLKIAIINQIWSIFFPSDFWMQEAIDFKKTISTKQIEQSYNFYSKNLLIKLSIRDVYNTQSTRYSGLGVIETTATEFFNSLGLTIRHFFNNNTDLYNFKDDL